MVSAKNIRNWVKHTKRYYLFLLGLLILIFGSSAAFMAYNTLDSSDGVISDQKDDQPNIVLIDLDLMSADRMPCYGHSRNTTPNICRFGDNNILFKNAISQSGWTAPSTASIFTGQYPPVHDLIDWNDSLSSDAVTLAETLKQAGYRTEAFPVNYEDFETSLYPGYNLDQGFDKYHSEGFLIQNKLKDIEGSLKSDNEKPAFLYIQGYGPHRYYKWEPELQKKFRKNYSGNLNDPPSLISEKTASDIIYKNNTYLLKMKNGSSYELEERDITHIKNQYDDAIYDTDRNVGKVLKMLKRKNMYSNSIIIITANHGESLDSRTLKGSQRFSHGTVWDDNIRVPFMVHIPDEESKTVKRQIQLIDVFPTLLEEISVEISAELEERLQGESMKPLYSDTGGYEGGYAFIMESDNYNFAVRNNTWKFFSSDTGSSLFNLRKDSSETENVIEDYPVIAKSMKSALERHKLENEILRTEIYNES